MLTEDQKFILNRNNKQLEQRYNIHQLILDSYKAGESYTHSRNLWQLFLEHDYEYKMRNERSVYISHTRLLIDTIIGFLYQIEVSRDIAKELEYIIEHANATMSLDKFIRKVAVYSCLFTVAILVDSPAFDPEVVRSIADREEAGLNPFCKLYMPSEIRDYAIDAQGKLDWIIFDDSFSESPDPLKKPTEYLVRTIWDKKQIRKYKYKRIETQKHDDKIQFESMETTSHNLGEVPVILCSFQECESEPFGESFAENIALLDRKVYNYDSLLDALLSKNAIKPLMYPSKDGKIPAALADSGNLNTLVVIPYPLDSTNKPYFLEAGNIEIQSYITAINLYLSEIKQLVGLTKDENYVTSGKAKIVELKKLEVILENAAKNMEFAENEIGRLLNLWEGKEYTYEVVYKVDFRGEDIDALTVRLYDLLTIDSPTLKTNAIQEIVKRTLPETDDETMKKITEEISGEQPVKVNNSIGELKPDNPSENDVKMELKE